MESGDKKRGCERQMYIQEGMFESVKAVKNDINLLSDWFPIRNPLGKTPNVWNITDRNVMCKRSNMILQIVFSTQLIFM